MFKPVIINSRTLKEGFRLPPSSRTVFDEVKSESKKGKVRIVESIVDTVVELQNISQQSYEVIMISGGQPQHYCLPGGGALTVPFGELSLTAKNLIRRNMLQALYK